MKRKNIIITGPESTGKTSLAEQLAQHYQGVWVPEYARLYLENLNRPYVLDDVLAIAEHQEQQYRQSYGDAEWIFFDTWLIITRVWLQVVYGTCPDWIDQAIRRTKVDLVLLCYPDLPWEPDPVRENGGEMRITLFAEYRRNLLHYGYPFSIVRGEGELRLQNAVKIINNTIT